MKKLTTHQLTLGAMLTVILIVLGPMSVPFGTVPVTMQTLAIGIVASIATWQISLSAVSLYIVLGVIGLPVFSNGHSGVAVLLGPTGGYIIGFIVYAILVGLWLQFRLKIMDLIVINILAMLVQLFIGTLWLKSVGHLTMNQALNAGFTPFVVIGLLKLIAVVAVSWAIIQSNQKQLLGS